MIKETIYLIRKRPTDRNGDPIGPELADQPIPGCVIWPRASEEKDGGEVNIDGQNVKCPDSATAQAIRSDDSISLRGEQHSVDEPPARYIGKAVMIKTRRVTT